MRALKFFGVFLLTALIIFGLVLGLNWKSFTTFLDNREALAEGIEFVSKTHSLRGLSEFMAENPQYASLASVVVHHPDSSIYFEADTPRALGTTANFFILAAYAIEIDSGSITGNEPIAADDITRYMLPDVEELRHSETLRTAERRGWLADGIITTRHALHLLAETNDMPLADYLWWNLEESVWKELPQKLGIRHTEMPLPFSGLYLAISPGIREKSLVAIKQEWTQADRDTWKNHVIGLSAAYAGNPEKRNTVQQYLQRNRLGNTFMEERDGKDLFPKGTASEFITLLEQMVSGTLVNANISQMVMNFMRWPVEHQRGIERNFTDYGALYDNRMGLMNGIDFGTSAYTGDVTVQALFFDKLPIGFWFHASGSHMHQDLMQRLIYDPAMISQMKQVAER